MPGRARAVDPELTAQRRAAGIQGAATRWGRAGGQPRGHGRAGRMAKRGTHQRIPVDTRVDNFHAATPRDALAPDRRWYRIDNQIVGGAVDVYIYDEIGYWGVTAQDFVLELAQVQATVLNVHLNSPGGDVFDGIAIYNALIEHPATVNVTVDALAASIASVIMMAGDTITMGRHSQVMIHEPYGMCVGNAKDMADMVAMLDRCADNIADVYADRAGGDVGGWREAMRAESWYTGAEAVTAGLADEVRSGREQPIDPASDTTGDDDVEDEPVAARWDLGVFQFAGRADAPAPDLTLNRRRTPAPTAAAPPVAPAPEQPVDVASGGGDRPPINLAKIRAALPPLRTTKEAAT